MAIIGIELNKENPEFTIDDFTFWLPQFKKFCATEDGIKMFNKLYPIANKKIFHSIFGTDWELGMSLCIAHYSYLIGSQTQTPSGDTLSEISGGANVKGVMTSASIGGFSKSFDLQYTALNSPDTFFWNQSAFGMQLMALYKSKPVPSIYVVVNGNVTSKGGNGNYHNGGIKS